MTPSSALSRLRSPLRMFSATLFAFSTICSASAFAQPGSQPTGPKPIAPRGVVPHDAARERALLQDVKVADGFTASIFAAPPIAMYPVCLTGTIDGAVFVCVDPNLSLTATKGTGKIVRLVDTNKDGQADEYTVFAEMDSPRGVAYDGRTLYVMHPPYLKAYRDTTGDGIADVSETLVTGLGFDLDFRGADHTTNGITLGIDGWLYIAVGDYGFRRAVGKDSTAITYRGGSVVRVRTDGTGLEMHARGTRNIYDLAVDPFLNVFTRDNTNDGDGWDIRLHYLPTGANMGYPALYKNFASEHMASLADYGGGSGTGGLFVHDPGFPNGYGNTLYTADWLLNQLFRHPLTPLGASYSVKQESFVTVPHPADMAMDGASNMFIASLAGGSYTYAGDSVGYVLRVRPTATTAPAATLNASTSDVALRRLLVSANAEYRIQAQREILRRGERAGVAAALTALARDVKQPAYARVAVMYTLKQLAGTRSHPTLIALASDPRVKELALRALADDTRQNAAVSSALFVKALADTSARVQVAAINGLVRLKATDAGAAIVPLAASTDPTVAHLAVNALVQLRAGNAAVTALSGTTPAVRAGALRALQQMHDPSVVQGLMANGVNERATPMLDIVVALARLYHREATWTGDWWGTRPSFIGPYFAPATWESSASIAPTLKSALNRATAADSSTLVDALIDAFISNRVLPQGSKALLLATGDNRTTRAELVNALVGSSTLTSAALPLLTRLSTSNAAYRTGVAQLLAGETTVVEGALPLVRAAALDPTVSEDARGKLLTMVAALPAREGLRAAMELLSSVTPSSAPAVAGTTPGPVEAAWRRFVGDRRRLQELDQFIDYTHSTLPDQRVLGFAVLLQAVRGNRAAPAVNEKVQPVLATAWMSRAASTELARAVAIMRLDAAYTTQLEAQKKLIATPPSQQVMNWMPLFNGKDLKDWDIKFAGKPLGENYRNTFRAQDGVLKVSYDQWPDFNNEFGHIFHKTPFSYYIVAVEYRFVGNQVTGAGSGNSWAIRNNGIMVHSQSAASMGLKQDFPISLEVQLLGGLGQGPRTTGNLCTPGTHVVMNDKLITTHCINSNSITYDGDQWVRMEAMVLGDSIIKHIVNGDTVMTYAKPQMGGGAANNTNPGVLVNGKMLSEGYISLQAETAPIEFRKVEIVNLKGCMNPQDANFKSYYVKSDPAACRKR